MSKSKDTNVEQFKEKGTLKAFFCGAKKALKNCAETTVEAKSLGGYGIIVLGAMATLSGTITDPKQLIGVFLVGAGAIIDAGIQQSDLKNRGVVGLARDGVKKIVNNLKVKSR